MPPGFELWRVCQAAIQYFQHLTIVELSDVDRRIALDLVEVGFCLGRLDTAREDARKVANSHSSVLRFAPWCERRVLHPLVVKELVRQGHDLGGMTSEDIASVVFFFHPELGPALLALDALASKFLEQFEDTNRTESEVDVEPFRTLAILVDGDDTTEGAWAKLGHSSTTRWVL
ncbi:MAG: hypothetical protein EA424_17210 [Planctomycetaceae bacterium]|nr:MAG: hypothetical protein EA424_17210 [Planctomycetaceae bacterium]